MTVLGTGATKASAQASSTSAKNSVWGWGTNGFGQLGNDDGSNPTTPVQARNLIGVASVASGEWHGLAVKDDGTVWGWGYNNAGQVGDGTYTNRSTPVQVNNLSGAVSVAGGEFHSLAVKDDGTVWAWGQNQYGRLGDGTDTSRSTPVQVSDLSGAVSVAGGISHSLAVKSDGTVWAWGQNSSGQLGDGTHTNRSTPVKVSNLSGVVSVAGGAYHSLALKDDGTVWAWGSDIYGQLGDGTDINYSATPVQVSNLSGAVSVAGGVYHSLAVKSDGTVWAWGYNDHGQLGDGTRANRSTPVRVSDLSGAVSVAGGEGHSLAVKSDGTASAWGQNNYGQLGDGTKTDRSTPVRVSDLSGVVSVAGGHWHSLALAADTTPPDTRITSGPGGLVDTNSASFTFSTTESGSTFECRLDGGTYGACDSPMDYTNLSEGGHTFEVRATDAAGNTDPTPASRGWTVAPVDTSITSGPSGTVNSRSPSLSFTTNRESGTFECSLDSGAFEACTSPEALSALSDGSHAFRVRATDTAGSTDATPAERTFTVDATAPTASPPAQSLVLNSQLGTNTVPVGLAWSATDALSGVINHTLQQSTNGGTYADVSLPTPTATTLAPSLGPGQAYQYRVQARDRASNLSAWQTGPGFTVDLRQERHQAVSYTGTWNLQAASTASGGYTRHASASGARSKFSFAGRNVAWVAPTGPNRGKAEVWIDGVKAATVDLYSPAAEARKMVFTRGWPTSGNHTLQVRVLGTKNAASTGKRVDVDAFVALR